jgi:beta-mannosidase
MLLLLLLLLLLRLLCRVLVSSRCVRVCGCEGLLVWQEVMFACAIYPAWPEFKASVRAEILYQTRRLSAHPSLVLWCGNNEAEQSHMMMHPEVWQQYYSLAYDVIVDTLKNVTATSKGSIALWPSSPSNGFQTAWTDPSDASRGDVHRYVCVQQRTH